MTGFPGAYTAQNVSVALNVKTPMFREGNSLSATPGQIRAKSVKLWEGDPKVGQKKKEKLRLECEILNLKLKKIKHV